MHACWVTWGDEEGGLCPLWIEFVAGFWNGHDMPNSLVIGLYPTAPITGAEFTNYLSHLSITAYEVDFENPTPVPDANHLKIGTATFNVPPQPDSIFQLEIIPKNPPPLIELGAAAAAIIPLPAGMNKYLAPESLINVVLDVRRDGVHLVDHSINYDVALANVVPGPSLDGVGLYLALEDPQVTPGAGPNTFLVPPPDGSPPPYDTLDAAIIAILAEDPGGLNQDQLSNLSAADCLHIARELVSNRAARPLPAPPSGADLGQLYTSDGSGTDQDRAQFQGGLLAYYNQINGDAIRMAGFVYAWSTAKKCETTTDKAANAAMAIPVRPTPANKPGLQAEATVILGN
jgi:hypothetical protein